MDGSLPALLFYGRASECIGERKWKRVHSHHHDYFTSKQITTLTWKCTTFLYLKSKEGFRRCFLWLRAKGAIQNTQARYHGLRTTSFLDQCKSKRVDPMGHAVNPVFCGSKWRKTKTWARWQWQTWRCLLRCGHLFCSSNWYGGYLPCDAKWKVYRQFLCCSCLRQWVE